MREFLVVLAALLLLPLAAAAQEPVKIGFAGKSIFALQWGKGSHAVIAIHGLGGKASAFGEPVGGELAIRLAAAGFRVIAPEWAAASTGGEAEIGAVVVWARKTGASKVSLLGHSVGASLAARVAQANPDGTFDSVVLLAMTSSQGIQLPKTKKLFVGSEGDSYAAHPAKLAEASDEPKRAVVLPGTGHMIFSLSNKTFALHEAVVDTLSRQ